ncbi:class C sortase [uncultured Oscillibacter sp.]|uniref:class C sortase n=1 Tax=uncultured Oscillibacter sp. TaxID=876091 RepID=UPI002729CCD6|nr:class C sortase [uncultured Oscillibacter sp.]
MKKHLSTVLLLLVLLAGVALLLYPTASDYWNSFHQSRAIAGYAESVSGLNAVDYEHIWRSARDYNARLLERANPFRVLEEDEADYNGELNVGNNGIMGYIEIPGIEVSLPIYHGTSDGVLQVAVGHLQGSSLPVGGPSTHCVLSGHRGLPSAKLFTNLDQLAEGDIFMLRILNETLTYEVDQIHIVLPDEMGDLVVQKGQDHCTLVTCTPYGINTHRLLVRGKRIETPEAASSARITADAVRIDPILVAPVAAAPMLLALFIWAIAAPGGGKKKSSGKRVKKQS